MQVIDEDQYTPAVVYGAGKHTFTREQIGTGYVLTAIRTLLDPANPKDLEEVHKLQEDGSITVQFGGCDDKTLNCLPIVPGWNYMVRLYRPRKAIRDGTWKFPEAQPVK